MKNLVFAPHIDDEVLGCFSQMQPESHICYFGVEDRDYVSGKERIREMEKAAALYGFGWTLFNNTVNRYDMRDLIGPMEERINALRPDFVFVPHFSYNQDHQAVYDAAMVALRPHDRNWFVPGVFVYEQPHTFTWPTKTFEPNFFFEIDVQEKVNTYQFYASQVRGHRSPELIKLMAQLRGEQAGVKHAEGFFCLRYVVKTPT
jgi:LmbE family N-acetylglucosaminyl deacetylase